MIVLTLTCNRLDLTKRTFEALYRFWDLEEPPCHIIVDNGSTDGTVDWLKSQSKYAIHTIVPLPVNLGFGTGWSVGMETARRVGVHEYILNLEGDWALKRPCLRWGTELLDKHPAILMVHFYACGEEKLRYRYHSIPGTRQHRGESYCLVDALPTAPPAIWRREAISKWFPMRSEWVGRGQGVLRSAMPTRAKGEFFEHIGEGRKVKPPIQDPSDKRIIWEITEEQASGAWSSRFLKKRAAPLWGQVMVRELGIGAILELGTCDGEMSVWWGLSLPDKVFTSSKIDHRGDLIRDLHDRLGVSWLQRDYLQPGKIEELIETTKKAAGISPLLVFVDDRRVDTWKEYSKKLRKGDYILVHNRPFPLFPADSLVGEARALGLSRIWENRLRNEVNLFALYRKDRT